MSYKVKLKSFEGPFDLLVYLIENAEMSIYDIQISEITGQYLDYIATMKDMDVSVATEFMVLAAELIEIKSKMILPRSGGDGEFVTEEDPRSDLVERLLEYKKFKRMAELLQEREEKMANIFEKPQEDIASYLEQPDEYLSLDIKQFAQAFDLFLKRKKKVEEVRKHYTRVERQKITLEASIQHIKDAFVKFGRKTLNFKELVPDRENNYQVVLTFSSLLELIKQKDVAAEQKHIYGDIEVTRLEEQDKEVAAGDK